MRGGRIAQRDQRTHTENHHTRRRHRERILAAGLRLRGKVRLDKKAAGFAHSSRLPTRSHSSVHSALVRAPAAASQIRHSKITRTSNPALLSAALTHSMRLSVPQSRHSRAPTGRLCYQNAQLQSTNAPLPPPPLPPPKRSAPEQQRDAATTAAAKTLSPHRRCQRQHTPACAQYPPTHSGRSTGLRDRTRDAFSASSAPPSPSAAVPPRTMRRTTSHDAPHHLRGRLARRHLTHSTRLSVPQSRRCSHARAPARRSRRRCSRRFTPALTPPPPAPARA